MEDSTLKQPEKLGIKWIAILDTQVLEQYLFSVVKMLQLPSFEINKW